METIVAIATPNPDVCRLLARARDAGIVLDYVLVDQVAPAPAAEVHRQAVHLGVRHASANRSVRPPSEPLPFEAGQRITLDEFFGPAFDRIGGRLLMLPSPAVLESISFKTRPDNVISGPFTWTNADDPERAVWFFDNSAPVGGYAVFFTQPPHFLTVPRLEVQSLFLDINHAVLGNPSDDTEIWRWSGDSSWSEYFEDGEEWWGTAAWTVRVTEERLVVVLGSATD